MSPFPRSHPHRVSTCFPGYAIRIGCLHSSITFTFDGNPDTRQSTLAPDLSLVNHDKYAKLGKIAVEFKRYQEVSHAPKSLLKEH